MIEITEDRMRVVGPMVITTATALKAAGESALSAGASVIDLSGVTDADSAAVAVLLAWTRGARERRQTLSIVESPESVRSLATLYGVAELLPLA
jgi:phospholipid transport system transporter-binding protein